MTLLDLLELSLELEANPYTEADVVEFVYFSFPSEPASN